MWTETALVVLIDTVGTLYDLSLTGTYIELGLTYLPVLQDLTRLAVPVVEGSENLSETKRNSILVGQSVPFLVHLLT